jgi:FAD/FMN-containing dehydrogenase/Fe-S oxidoreductase
MQPQLWNEGSSRDMNASQQRQTLSQGPCEVRFDGLTRQLYATDASIYQIEPMGVAFPRSVEETADVVRRAVDAGVPVTPRGAGTGLAGGALGDGVIVDLARHNRKIYDYDPERRTVRVGAGVVLDQLNAFLRQHGMQFGPDVATSSRATLGGMIANDSSGARAPLYGTTAQHVRALEVVTAGGEKLWLSGDNAGPAELAEAVQQAVLPLREVIEQRFPDVLVKRWPGFGFDRYLRSGGRLDALLPASEGVLGLVFSAELDVVPLPREKALGLFFFDSVDEAMSATVEFLDLKPAAVEHIDRVLLDQTKGKLNFKAARDLLQVDDDPAESVLIVELYDNVDERLAELERRKVGRRRLMVRDAAQMQHVWAVRKAGLNLLTGRKGPAKPTAGIEDAAVVPKDLPAFVRELEEIMQRQGLQASYYGHAASGLLHVRPIVDLHDEKDLQRFRAVADAVSALTRRFRGSFAAEHGVGMARTEYMSEHVGLELMTLHAEVKRIMDPKGVLNPGKIIPEQHGRAYRIDAHLRQGAGRALELPFDPQLAFASRDESFVANLEQCNGCGGCRKDEPTMCPTYMATGDEIMSTRGRANTIRAFLEGRLRRGRNGLDSKELSRAIENCLACKACTKECPSNVNMTLLKAELLHARHQQVGLTLRERMVSSIDLLGKLGCMTPRLANAVLKSNTMRRIMDEYVGFTSRRPFPKFTRQRFDKWFRKRDGAKLENGSRGTVYLWDDTSVRYYEPNIGQAAVKVLEAADYSVHLVEGRKCCGRPAFSTGCLDQARELGQHNVDLLRSLGGDAPLVFLEPSCYSMFVEDYRELGVNGSEEVARRCVLFEEFIADLLERDREALPLRSDLPAAAMHSHCHAKALSQEGASSRLAALLPDAPSQYLETGCCGMAGQFGQLSEKYDLSVAVGEDLAHQIKGLPAETAVVANGTSCRSQIEHLCERKPVHIAEWLAGALEEQEASQTRS